LRTRHGWQGCLLRRSIRATRAVPARSRCVGIVTNGTGLIKRIFVVSNVGTRPPPTIMPRRIFVAQRAPRLPSTSLWCPPLGVRRKPRRFSPGYLTINLLPPLDTLDSAGSWGMRPIIALISCEIQVAIGAICVCMQKAGRWFSPYFAEARLSRTMTYRNPPKH